MYSVITRRAAAVFVIVIAAAYVAATACGSDNADGERSQAQPTHDTAAVLDQDTGAETVEAMESIKVGRNVGERVPDFTITFDGGTVQTSVELIEAGRPVFMFFFSTWCPVCRGEMAQLKEIYPEFADEVDFIAVGQDPTESLDSLVKFAEQQDNPWPVALPGQRMLAELRITSQSFKIAFDGRGVIVYRDGFGGGGVSTWQAVMADLASR